MCQNDGGGLDAAIRRFGNGTWIDLSTDINRRPWPVDRLSTEVSEPDDHASAMAELRAVAGACFGCRPDRVLPLSGSSDALAAITQILPVGNAVVVASGWDHHPATLRGAGWPVTTVQHLNDLASPNLVVVQNPNNPDGREWSAASLAEVAKNIDHLIVDECFADPRPDLSLAPTAPDNAMILRSFGPFWGLPRLQLAFVIAAPKLLQKIASMPDANPVSGHTLTLAAAAMADRAWTASTIDYLAEASLRLDHLAIRAGWKPVGGTHLFRLYAMHSAVVEQDRLARARIWTRRLRDCDRRLRLGIPATRDEWDRVSHVLSR